MEDTKEIEINKITEKYRLKRLALKKRGLQIERELLSNQVEQDIWKERYRSQKLIEEIEKNSQIETAKKEQLIKAEHERLQKFENKLRLRAKLKDLENQMEIEKAKLGQKISLYPNERDWEKYKAKELLKIEKQYLEARLQLYKDYGGKEHEKEVEQIKARLAEIGVVQKRDKLESWKKLAEGIKEIMTQVAEQVENQLSRAIQATEKAIAKQDKLIEEQRRRAEQGLSNTLAFEQREKAKKEAELIKQQKKLERLQKIKAIYTSYTNYANQGDKNPILKALRDFAMLETITASFGEGGIVGIDGVEKVRTSRGITLGRSHKMNKGILAYHEGGEGFLSRREVQNIGVDNFYKFKEMARLGILDQNFFTKQNKAVIINEKSSVDITGVIKELKEVKKAIKSNQTQTIDLVEVVNGVMQFTETITKGNKVIRNQYKINKDRL